MEQGRLRGALNAVLVGVAIGLGVAVVEVASGMTRGIHYPKALRLGNAGVSLVLTYVAAFGGSSLLVWLVANRLVAAPATQLRLLLCAPFLLVVGGLTVTEPGVLLLLSEWPWIAVVPASIAICLGIAVVAMRRSSRLRAHLPFFLVAATITLATLSTRIRLLVPPRLDRLSDLRKLALVLLLGLLLARYLSAAFRDWGPQLATRPLVRVAAFLMACSLLLLLAVPTTWLYRLPPPSDRAGRPSLLLIVIDTLRADAISPMGADPEATPALTALARDGIVFERAYAAAPWTLPSFASILTSTYPREHGTGYRQPTTLMRTALPSSLPTLAETLQGAGYATGASVTNPYLEPRYRLERGFSTYEPLSWKFQFHPPMVFLWELFAGERPWYVDAQAQERRITDLIGRLELSGSPWFVLAHMFDPHTPYFPHDGTDAADDEVTRYRGEVSYVDRWIGELMNDLRRRGLYDELLIAFTADHGEELTEARNELRTDGVTPHGFSLYDELLRVPLILKLPGGEGAGRRIEQPVSLVDIAPTLLRAAGLESPGSFRGLDLRSALSDGAALEDRTIFAGGLMEVEQLDAVLRGSRKLVTRSFPPVASESYVFDLAGDPGESRPAALRESRAADATLFLALEHELDRTGHALSVDEAVTVMPGSRKQLEALGYVQ